MKIWKIFIILFLILVLAGGCFYFYFQQEIYLATNTNNKENFLFEVAEGENVFLISQHLEEKNLIRNKMFFQLYAFLIQKYDKLKAGFYHLNQSMNTVEIVETLTQGKDLQIKVTIPEGFTVADIEERMDRVLGYRVQGLGISNLKLKEFKPDYEFLKEVPDNTSSEGFLFPDTYFFEPNISESEIIEIFLKNFDKKLSNELREEIKNQNKSIFDIVIMASLLEKEVKTLMDKRMVADVLWKRLDSNIPLQVDATIIYITGKKTTRISKEETQIDSPYNTYKYLGLPIGPICNPGLDSIIAAIEPTETNFWYYLSAPDGKTIFSETLEKHNLAKQRYLK